MHSMKSSLFAKNFGLNDWEFVLNFLLSELHSKKFILTDWKFMVNFKKFTANFLLFRPSFLTNDLLVKECSICCVYPELLTLYIGGGGGVDK
jgi:hypothetical protein